MRPQRIQVGPLAASDADGISTTQTAAAAQQLVLNGALADEVATGICASQSAAGAGNLTINGSLASGGIAYLRQNRAVYITSAADESGVTFTITGTYMPGAGPNTVPVAQSETVTGADTSTVCTTKQFYTVTQIAVSGATTGNVTVGMNGVATLDTARRVLITTTADETGITFALTGTDYAGVAISETIAGVNNTTTYTTQDFKTVTSIFASGATAGALTIGTNGIASSPWANFDPYAVAQVVGECVVSGTVNYTVQQTMDDPTQVGQEVARTSMTWLDSGDTAVVSATASKMTSFTFAPRYCRITLNSNTNPGYVVGTFNQFYGSMQPPA